MFGIHSGTISGESSPNSSKFLASAAEPKILCAQGCYQQPQKCTTGNAQSALIWDSPSQCFFSYYQEESEFAVPPCHGDCQQFQVLVLPVPAQVGRIPWRCTEVSAPTTPSALFREQRCPGLSRLSGYPAHSAVPQLPPYL